MLRREGTIVQLTLSEILSKSLRSIILEPALRQPFEAVAYCRIMDGDLEVCQQ